MRIALIPMALFLAVAMGFLWDDFDSITQRRIWTVALCALYVVAVVVFT